MLATVRCSTCAYIRAAERMVTGNVRLQLWCGNGRVLAAEETCSILLSCTYCPDVVRVGLLMAACFKVEYEVLTVMIPARKYVVYVVCT
jgi:hypothetical protein